MNVDDLSGQVTVLGALLRARGERLATAESCTGGLIAAACTTVAGSSDWFERGFVSYSNEAKRELLGVPESLLSQHGAVSEAAVQAMALGALARAPVQWSLAVTGIAGPGGGSPAKPVGTVWLALARAPAELVSVERLQFRGDRSAIRRQTVERALQRLMQALQGGGTC